MTQTEVPNELNRALGLRHVGLMLTSPRAVFSSLEDTGAYGWALVVILSGVLLIGYVEVQTGLIDRVVDQQTEVKLAALEDSQAHLVDRVELRERMQDIRKAGVFTKLLQRLGAVVLAPVYMLASFLFIAAVLYAAVALTGRKPEYQTLMSICVFSAFIELIGQVLRLAMVIFYRTTEVSTSLDMLSEAGKPSLLAAIDPFRIWFWVLVVTGLIVTRQLSRRVAILTCTTLALFGAGLHVAIAFAGAA